MRKIILGVLILSITSICNKGEAVRLPDDFVLDNLPKVIEQLKRTSVLIVATDKKNVVGTGFLTIDEGKKLLVVTNKHVAVLGNPIFVRVNTPGKVIDYLADIYKVDVDLDIVVLTLKKINPDQQWISTDLAIPLEMYGKQEDIIEGKEVIYIGYPLGRLRS